MENLDSILGGQAAAPAASTTEQPAATAAATPAAQPEAAEPKAEGTQATGDDTTATPAAPQKDDHLEKARKGLEAAVKAERDKRQAAEQRAQQIEAELRAERERRQPQASDADAPQRAQFPTDEAYFRALGRYEAKQEREAEMQREAHERAVRERLERETVLSSRTHDVVAQAMAIDGFDFGAFAQTPITEPMMEAILESEAGGAVVHHLAAHPKEAADIAKLAPAAQVRAIVRLEEKLKADPAAAQAGAGAAPAASQVQLPKTLTNERDTRGRFTPAYQGPTPLNAILGTR